MRASSKPSEPLTVLVTAAGSGPAISVLRSLRQQDHVPLRLVTCDAQDLVAGRAFADAFHRVPPVGEGYIAAVEGICARERVTLVIPSSDGEALALQAATRLRDEGVRVACAAYEDLVVLTDKSLAQSRLEAAGVPSPRGGPLEDGLPDDPPWPLILKPRRGGSGGTDVRIARGPGDLDAVEGDEERYCWQQFIEGDEFTVDTVSDFSGRPLAAVPRQRLAIRVGQSYKGLVLDDANLIDVACGAVEALHVVGGGNVQCIRDASGGIHVIEVNPRFAAALGITVAGGEVNTPLILARVAAGEEVAPTRGPRRSGVRVARYWSEAVIDEGEGYDSLVPPSTTDTVDRRIDRSIRNDTFRA